MACVRKYRGSWVVDWRDPSGRRFIEAQEDKQTAERRLAEVINSGKAPSSKKIAFKDRAEWWLENVARQRIRSSTYQEYKAVLTNHVYPMLEKKPFVKVNRTMIRELVMVKKKEGLSHSTIRNILAPIRGMYFEAIEDGIIHYNPVARAGTINKKSKDAPKTEICPLTREEIQTLLMTALVKTPTLYPLLLCACRAGLRQGELVALKAGDIDFNGKFIEVRRNLSRGEITTPKNGKIRKVDMSTQLAAVLNELLSKRRADALRREMKKTDGERQDSPTVIESIMDDWLFQSPVGSQLDPSNLRKAFTKVLTHATLRTVRFHDLRHGFARLLLGNGESLTYVKDQMGHSSINVTVDIYGHLIAGSNRAAVDKLDDQVPAMADKKPAGKQKAA